MNLGRLTEKFDPNQVAIKAQAVNGDQCLAVAYLDARQVGERLEEVFGVGNCRVSHLPLPGNIVKTQLEVWSGGDNWDAFYEDFGYPNGAEDREPLKSAASDGLKRSAVHLGIGRYLYDLPLSWVPYNQRTRKPYAETLEELQEYLARQEGYSPEPTKEYPKPPARQKPTLEPGKADICDKCGWVMNLIPAGVSKKTNKPYDAFWACSSKECKHTKKYEPGKQTQYAPDAFEGQ